jgi:tellurite resistance protein
VAVRTRPVLAGKGATPARLVTANLSGIPFGFAGLAQCWSTAHAFGSVASWPGQLLWVLTALVYVSLLVPYVRNVIRTGRVATEVGDRTFGPFTALILIIPMLIGVALAGPAPRTGMTIFLVSMTMIALYGGWVSAQWIVQTVPLERWHPGYFLPTVAGPLLAAGGCATLGLPGLARVLFGYGLVCWVVLGSIILARLFTAAVTLSIRWLVAGHVPAQRPLTYVLLAVATLGIVTLAARTVLALLRGTFLPRPSAPARVAG